MQTVPLGKTGLRVSSLGMSPAAAAPGGGADRDAVIAAVRRGVERGITLFDTNAEADAGEGERLLGEALGGSREQVLIAAQYPCNTRLSPGQLTEGLRASLDRLRTRSVDLLLLGGDYFGDEDARFVANSGIVEWADEMQSKGLCRLTGITAELPSGGLERLLKTWCFDVLRIGYDLLRQSACSFLRDSEPVGAIPLARSMGMGILATQGAPGAALHKLLATEYPELDAGRLARLSVQFVLAHHEIDCAVVPMSTAAEVDIYCDLADPPAPPEMSAAGEPAVEQ